MGGNDDDDKRSDLDKWFESQAVELRKFESQIPRISERFDDDNDTFTSSSSSSRSPFERFKTFVDANFNTFTEGFKNFPSNVSELKARMQAEREARREEEVDIWMRWTGSEDSPDHIRMQVERASPDERAEARSATYSLLRQSYLRTRHMPHDKIHALYRDDEWSLGPLDQFAAPLLSFGGACYYKPETVDNLPSTARWGWPQPKPQWLSVDWFKRSSYSPIRLEAHPELCTAGSSWRAAFEDLVSASLDQPMRSEEKVGQRTPYGKPQSTFYGPGLDWMLSLQCRGILPPQLPSMYKAGGLWDGRSAIEQSVLTNATIETVFKRKDFRPHHPSLDDDFNALVDEVAIKSGPEIAAKPLTVQASQIEQTFWRVPDTEAELYENLFDYPDRKEPAFGGGHSSDRNNAYFSLFDALLDEDLDEASTLLIAYHRAYGAVGDITRSISHKLRDELTEALERTDIPVRAWWTWTSQEEEIRDRTQRWRQERVGEKREEVNRVRESWGPYVGGELMNPSPGVPAMTGLEDVDFEAATDALWDAVRNGDPTTAARCIDAFDKAYATVGAIADDLIMLMDKAEEGVRVPMITILKDVFQAALDRTHLPKNYDYAVHGRYDNKFSKNYENSLQKDQRAKEWEEREQAREEREKSVNPALQDYQMQLMLLDQQKKKRLRLAEEKQRENEAQEDAVEAKHVQPSESPRPDVLSQLTTTQTTRLPDGTVTTKVVLKKKFADGREETHESVHTENERQPQTPAVSGEKKPESKGRGWFWN